MSLYDLLSGFRSPSDGLELAKSFRNTFPDAAANGVVMIAGGKTAVVKLGTIDSSGVMNDPDAAIHLDVGARGRWAVSHFAMKEDYFAKNGPQGRLLDLNGVMEKEQDSRMFVSRLIELKATGATLHEAASAADNMGSLASYIEDIESGRIKDPLIATTKPVEVPVGMRSSGEYHIMAVQPV